MGRERERRGRGMGRERDGKGEGKERERVSNKTTVPEKKDSSSDSPVGWQEPEREKLTAFSSSFLVSSPLVHLPPPHCHSTRLQHP